MRLSWSLVVVCLLVSGGCSSNETAWVSGNVTYDGKEVPDGALRFFPTEGTEGTGGRGAGAKIVDGRYEISTEMAAKRGLVAGGYRITVVASRKTGRKVPNPDGGGMDEEYKMYIPRRYNRQSNLHVELKAGANEHDLLLDR